MDWETKRTKRHKNRVRTSLVSNLPTEPLQWIKESRPYVGKVKRDFSWEPFWVDVYKTRNPNVVVVNGRQTFKSTFGTDIIGCYVTSHDNIEVTYVVDREDRAAAWSKQRFRKDTMLRNKMLTPFLMHGRANVGEINFSNNSVLYVRTDQDGYNNVQGMTNSLMVYDECQYQDLQFRSAALYSMTMTKGQCYYLGIGGELGSEWNRMWEKTNQNEWVFDDVNWRDKLQFDDKGYLSNDNPQEIVAGKWIPQKPENKDYVGYHMPQTIFARIPLTISDAVNLYKTRPENSIEFQRKYNPSSMVAAHVDGLFYKALRRPITPQMVELCKSDDTLLTGDEVKELKNIHKNDILVTLGIDWGSGPAASSTVGSIIIYWKKINRYQLVHIDIDPCELEIDEPQFFINRFVEYGVDVCVGDMGYGKDKVQQMQKSLGYSKVHGAWSSGNLTQSEINYSKVRDMEGVKKREYISVDKTEIIQNFIDMIGTFVDVDGKQVSQFILPNMDDKMYYNLEIDFCDITRKDLDRDNTEISKDDPRQKAKKEFNHPKDTVMSIIYNMIAKSQDRPGSRTITLIGTSRPKRMGI